MNNTTTNMTYYGVYVTDAFDHEHAPLSHTADKKKAQAQAHYTLVKGTHPLYGEVTAVQVKVVKTV